MSVDPKDRSLVDRFLPLIVTYLAVIIDQATKLIVVNQIPLNGEIRVIPGFFKLVYVRNTGAAFGMFGNQTYMLAVISIVMLIGILIFRRYIMEDRFSHRLAFGLLIGGIIGNLIDRIKDTYVTDFLDFYIGSRHWPAFNVADSCICVAVGIYLLTSFITAKPPPPASTVS